eukprot:6173328-Pleurochrysis_carterae.AAC.2
MAERAMPHLHTSCRHTTSSACPTVPAPSFRPLRASSALTEERPRKSARMCMDMRACTLHARALSQPRGHTKRRMKRQARRHTH